MKSINFYLSILLILCFSVSLFSQAKKIVPSQGWDESLFGYELAIADGQLLAADHGLLFFYELENANWIEKSIIPIETSAKNPFYQLPSLAIDQEAIAGVKRFSLSDTQESTGAVYFFTKNNGTWSQSQKLEPDFLTIRNQFGASVSILGDLALVGAPGDNEMGAESGAAYLLKKENDIWGIQKKLLGSSLSVGAQFGSSVYLSNERLIIGAVNQEYQGLRTGVAFVFKKSGEDWVEEGILFPSDADTDLNFGRKVRVENDLALVSSTSMPNMNGEFKGAAYFYSFDGSEWQEERKVLGEENREHDGFAWSIDLSEEYATLGAVWEGGDEHKDYSGRAYVYKRVEDAWSRVSKLAAFDKSGASLFGSAVGISETQLAIGASSDHTVHGYAGGAIYVYDLDIVNPVKEVVKLQSNQFKLTPNPTSDFIWVEKGATSVEITAFDLTGHLLENRKYNNEALDVSEWAPGIYFLEIRNAGKKSVQKFVKR